MCIKSRLGHLLFENKLSVSTEKKRLNESELNLYNFMERGGFGQRDLLSCRALMRGKEAVLGAEAVGTFANHGLLDQRQFFVA